MVVQGKCPIFGHFPSPKTTPAAHLPLEALPERGVALIADDDLVRAAKAWVALVDARRRLNVHARDVRAFTKVPAPHSHAASEVNANLSKVHIRAAEAFKMLVICMPRNNKQKALSPTGASWARPDAACAKIARAL